MEMEELIVEKKADDMYEIDQDKLNFVVKAGYMGGMIPDIVLTQKGKELISSQREPHARALRYLRMFEFSNDDIFAGKSIEVNAEFLLKAFKLCKEPISRIGLTKDKLHILNGNKEFFIKYESDDKVSRGLPFEMDGDIPLIGVDKIPLNVHVSFDTIYLNEIISVGKITGGEFTTFKLQGESLSATDNMDDYNTHTKLNIDHICHRHKDVKATYSYAIKEMSKGFDKKLITNLKFCNNGPAWFYQKTDDYILGVLIPPYVEDDDD